MEVQIENEKTINEILTKVNNGEFNNGWLKIRIDKKGQIAKILLEKDISLNVATSKIKKIL